MIVLLGGSGFIGTALRQALETRGLKYVSLSRTRMNYCDRKTLDDFVRELRPDFLINAAGFVGKPNVDNCELHKEECLRANVALPEMIREVCGARRLPWGHVSSGCIFQGSGPPGHDASPDPVGFSETDAPNFTFRHNNCSFYSGSKKLGEEALAGAECCYVWRIRMPFSAVDSERNYLSKLMRYPRLLDVRNSLSHLDESAEACVDCWLKQLEFGTYHLTNTGSVTTREVTQLLRASGVCDKTFEFFASEEEFLKVAATTVRSSCVLDNRKVRNAGLQLSDVKDALERSLRDWRPVATMARS